MSLRLRSRAKSSKAPELGSWGVVLIRSRGQLLGYVEAPDRNPAELSTAMKEELGPVFS
jgi:hypothetical protein